MKNNIKHNIGDKFGTLTLIERIDYGTNNPRAIFKCDCGKLQNKFIKNVTRGLTHCSCLNLKIKAITKHGLSRTRFEHIWNGMVCRCHKTYNQAYKRYGAKGITVCNEWRNFQGFIDDMYESYIKHVEEFGEKETTIDRVDGTKGYYKENCRWATNKEQANNTCTNLTRKFMEDLDGSKISIPEFIKKYNLDYQTLKRKTKAGISLKNIAENNIILSLEKEAYKEVLIQKNEIINSLEKRLKQILEYRFGLNGKEVKTLNDIGVIFKISKERVRQLEKKALEIFINKL